MNALSYIIVSVDCLRLKANKNCLLHYLACICVRVYVCVFSVLMSNGCSYSFFQSLKAIMINGLIKY